MSVQLFDARGRMVLETDNLDSPIDIDVGQLQEGMYYVRLLGGLRTEAASFFKK